MLWRNSSSIKDGRMPQSCVQFVKYIMVSSHRHCNPLPPEIQYLYLSPQNMLQGPCLGLYHGQFQFGFSVCYCMCVLKSYQRQVAKHQHSNQWHELVLFISKNFAWQKKTVIMMMLAGNRRVCVFVHRASYSWGQQHLENKPWGPFLESPGYFSGP